MSATDYGAYRCDREAVLETVQEIAKTVVADQAVNVDQLVLWPEQGIRALQQAGLGGMAIPQEFGGLGQGSYAVAQTCEILGQECASTAMCFGMHLVGSAVLAAKATPDQQVRYLQPIIEGRHLTTLSLSESGSGSQFYIPRTRLDAVSADLYRVNGAKAFVTNGGHADSYVISTVAADPDGPVGQFSCVVIPATAEGLRWGPAWTGLGMRGNSSLSLEIKDLVAPRADLLGEA